MVLVHDNSKICDPLAVVMTELCALQPSGFDFLVFSPQELQGYLWPKHIMDPENWTADGGDLSYT
jgi:hypothetical protein